MLRSQIFLSTTRRWIFSHFALYKPKHYYIWQFFCQFGPIKYTKARNSISSGWNENLRPLLDSNMGKVTIKKWYQNLILTTRIVNNGFLGVFGPKNASTPIFDYCSGQNRILKPLFESNYNHIYI